MGCFKNRWAEEDGSGEGVTLFHAVWKDMSCFIKKKKITMVSAACDRDHEP
jgi:hypothetical protein